MHGDFESLSPCESLLAHRSTGLITRCGNLSMWPRQGTVHEVVSVIQFIVTVGLDDCSLPLNSVVGGGTDSDGCMILLGSQNYLPLPGEPRGPRLSCTSDV